MKPANLLINSALSLAANVSNKAANVFAFLLITQLADPHTAGVFSLATTYLAIFTGLMASIDELSIRQMAREPQASSQLFNAYFALRLVLSGLCYGALALVVHFLAGYQATTSLALLIFGISLIPENLGLASQAALIAHENFRIPLLASFSSLTLKLLGAIIVLAGDLDTNILGWAWIVGSSLGAVIAFAGASRYTRPFHIQWQPFIRFWQQNFQLLTPFLRMGLFLTLEYQIDVIILSFFHNETVVSQYSAAATIAFAFYLLAQSIRIAVFPVMVRYQKEAPEKLARFYDRLVFYLGALALPISAGLILISPSLIELIYPPDYQNAALPLQILSAFILFHFLTIPNSRMLLVYNQQNYLIQSLFASMVVNLSANLLLIPSLGAIGAATARVLSALTIFLLTQFRVTSRLHAHNLLRNLAAPVFAALVMAVGILLIRPQSLWFAIPFGVILDIIALLSIRPLSYEEKLWLRNSLKSFIEK